MSALILSDLDIIGFCSECGMKVYDHHADLNMIDVYHCENCNKKHYLNELWEYVPLSKSPRPITKNN
jgi:hypothetical protein